MNAVDIDLDKSSRDINLEKFPMDVILKRIEESFLENPKGKRVSITLTLDIDIEGFERYEDTLNVLKKRKIIGNFTTRGHSGFVGDDEFGKEEVFFYTCSFTVNQKKLNTFLVATSRIPKYFLKMDNQRRLILNDKYIISTTNYESSNWFFVDYCLKHPGQTITKEAIEKSTSQILLRFHAILSNLRIAPHLTKIFFPNVATNVLKFRNDVTLKDFGTEIDENKINKYINTLKKI